VDQNEGRTNDKNLQRRKKNKMTQGRKKTSQAQMRLSGLEGKGGGKTIASLSPGEKREAVETNPRNLEGGNLELRYAFAGM